jgi:hypothetical protein
MISGFFHALNVVIGVCIFIWAARFGWNFSPKFYSRYKTYATAPIKMFFYRVVDSGFIAFAITLMAVATLNVIEVPLGLVSPNSDKLENKEASADKPSASGQDGQSTVHHKKHKKSHHSNASDAGGVSANGAAPDVIEKSDENDSAPFVPASS